MSEDLNLGTERCPVLIIAGLRDGAIRLSADRTDGRGPFSVDSLYDALAGRGKAMMYDIEGGSHLIVWQQPYRHKLHDLSIEWLKGFTNAQNTGSPGAPDYVPVTLPFNGSGRYLVSRSGGPPEPWNGVISPNDIRRTRDGLIVVRPGG